MISEKSLDYLITCCPWFTNLLTTYFSALLDTNYLIRDVCEDPYRPHTVLVLCWVKSKSWTRFNWNQKWFGPFSLLLPDIIKSSHCHNDYRHRQHHRSDRSLQARPAITWSASVFPDGLPSTTHHVVATHQGSTNNTRTLTSSLAGRPTMILPSKTAVYQTLAKQCRETVESRILQTVVHKRDSLSSSLSVLLMSSQAPGKCARSSL